MYCLFVRLSVCVQERLEDNDYVGMVAVLAHAYASRHGYDYVQVRFVGCLFAPLPNCSIHRPDPRLPSL